MLAQRLLTAAIGIPIIVVVIFIGGVLFTAVVSVILAIAAIEFVHMMMREERPLWRPSVVALVAAVGCAAMPIIVAMPIIADTGDIEWPPELAIAVGLVFLYLVVRRSGPAEALPAWAAIIAAIAYIGLLGSYFVLLRDLNEGGAVLVIMDYSKGAYWVLWAVLSTWGTDTCAYAVGKVIGRHKMAPSISPGKTWEGTAGAIIGGFLIVLALGLVLKLKLPVSTGQAVLLGLMLPTVAVIADLGESVLKRSAGVKDTSELVPGHGGFLDRLDSLLFTVPLVYLFAVWVVQ